jgi:hypothetical protein
MGIDIVFSWSGRVDFNPPLTHQYDGGLKPTLPKKQGQCHA